MKNHSLEKISEVTIEQIRGITNEHWAKKASALIVITGVFERTTIKYTNRGYRYVLLEAGHLAQNFYLIAPSIGLNISALGGYVDNKVNELIDVDGLGESTIYMFAVGEA